MYNIERIQQLYYVIFMNFTVYEYDVFHLWI